MAIPFAVAQEKTGGAELDRELTVNDYKNLPVLYEEISANNAILQKESVVTRTELRLRSIGLEPLDVMELRKTPAGGAGGLDHWLYVAITVTKIAFDVRVEFQRVARWSLPNGRTGVGIVSTWESGFTGAHGGDPSTILRRLDEILDEFLDAYLKANQDDK